MTDIKQIAATCANRIFDRMELCRGSAMLKSDIEREVETALREYAVEFDDDDIEGLEAIESEFCTVISEHTVKGADACFTVTGDPGAIIGKPYSVLTAEKEFHDAYERIKEFLTEKTIDPPCLITPKQAEERGIPMGAGGYVPPSGVA